MQLVLVAAAVVVVPVAGVAAVVAVELAGFRLDDAVDVAAGAAAVSQLELLHSAHPDPQVAHGLEDTVLAVAVAVVAAAVAVALVHVLVQGILVVALTYRE